MGFKLKILGSNSAKPAYNRNQTSQLLTVENELFLIDCGEGTQLQLDKYKVKISKIKHILISHLHGDHYFGLIGLLSTMHLQRRTRELYLYAPKGLAEIITLQLKASSTILSYTVHFEELDTKKIKCIFKNGLLSIETIPLTHRVPCTGFLFRGNVKAKKIIKEKIRKDFSVLDMVALKKGEDILDEKGNLKYRNEDYTHPPKRPSTYAYCSDTLYNEKIVEQIKNVDLLYHEATFLNDREIRAKETFHSTARQAAKIAKMANVELLMIGHFSSRYKDLTPFLEESKEVFEKTILAVEGESTLIGE